MQNQICSYTGGQEQWKTLAVEADGCCRRRRRMRGGETEEVVAKERGQKTEKPKKTKPTYLGINPPIVEENSPIVGRKT